MKRLAGVCSALLAFAGGCDDGLDVSLPRDPAALSVVATPAASVAAGTVAGDFVVRVTDDDGAAMSGVVVSFSISMGAGVLSTLADTTDADGRASTTFRANTTPGANEISAIARGLPAAKVSVVGTAGPTNTVAVTPRRLRMTVSQDSAVVTVATRDTFGNATADAITWESRNPAVATVTLRNATTASVRVVSRPGQTWVVATSGAATDSVFVAVLDAASSPCAFLAAPQLLAVGAVVPFDTGVVCVRSSEAGAEYAIVAHHNTTVADVAFNVETVGNGISPAGAFPKVETETPLARDWTRDEGFEHATRAREASELRSRTSAARRWYRGRQARGPDDPAVAYSIPPNVREGDLVTLNVNATDFCTNVQPTVARVAAVTSGAVVLADTTNPEGGFTDGEYRAFAVAMDTLVNPVDTGAFGAPTDIDGNGRVGILFTRAVNALTSQSSPSIVLGYYYARDLLPRKSPFGDCPGSNVAEMFYLLVPDPNGSVNSNPRSKVFVQSVAVATIAHEYQHLINASRRMYVTNSPRVDEEVWLNEGLSHIAEELVFYESDGASPRGNVGGAELAPGTPVRAMFDVYQRGNFGRYREYLRSPELNGPLALNDALATRGAAWSFLRYLADRIAPEDGTLWRRLVNAPLTGAANLEAALAGSGTTLLGALRDWSVSVIADDLSSAPPTVFRQPSWNFVTGMPAVGLTFALASRALIDGLPTNTLLIGGGSSYMRFAVAQDREALLRITGFNGAALSPAIRLSLIRIR
jgi:hypothetical protein